MVSGERDAPVTRASSARANQGIGPQGPGDPGQRRWITPRASEVVRDRPGKAEGALS